MQPLKVNLEVLLESLHSRSVQVAQAADGIHPTVFIKDESSNMIKTILVDGDDGDVLFDNVFANFMQGLRQQHPNNSWIAMSLIIEPLPKSKETEILLTTVQTQGGPMMMIYTEFDVSSGGRVKKDVSTLSKEQVANLPQMCPPLFEPCARSGRWCPG